MAEDPHCMAAAANADRFVRHERDMRRAFFALPHNTATIQTYAYTTAQEQDSSLARWCLA
jgi:hypothetical protein